jgi:hypothetical protein
VSKSLYFWSATYFVPHSVCVLHPFPCSKNSLSIILLTSLNSIVTPETNTSEHDIRWRSRSYFQSTSLIAIICPLLCLLNLAFAAFIFPRICCVHSFNMQLVTVLGAAALLTNTAFAVPQELEKKSAVCHIILGEVIILILFTGVVVITHPRKTRRTCCEYCQRRSIICIRRSCCHLFNTPGCSFEHYRSIFRSQSTWQSLFHRRIEQFNELYFNTSGLLGGYH